MELCIIWKCFSLQITPNKLATPIKVFFVCVCFSNPSCIKKYASAIVLSWVSQLIQGTLLGYLDLTLNSTSREQGSFCGIGHVMKVVDYATKTKTSFKFALQCIFEFPPDCTKELSLGQIFKNYFHKSKIKAHYIKI